MNAYDKIQYLRRYRDEKRKFEIAKRNLEELETYLFNISPGIPAVKVQTSVELDRIAGKIDRWNKLYNQCLDAQKESLKVMAEVMSTINTLDNPVYQSILTGQYIQGKPLITIANEIGYEYSYVTRLRKKAIAEIKIP